MVLMLLARVLTFVTYSLVKLLNPPFAGLVKSKAPAVTREAEEDSGR